MRTINLLAFFLLVAIDASDAIAQSDAALFSRLDSIAGADVTEERAVGLVVAVVKGKDKLLLEAYGNADADGSVAMTANTVIPIGSVSKQFTAAAILQLRDAGRLGLDDPMAKWLPAFESRGDGVTLRHLLGHTAGIPEFGQMQELHEMRLLTNQNVGRDSVYEIISRYAPQFPAGTMQVYSNTGYWLLGRVIEKVSGMTYEEYVEKRMFEPLGMTRSMYCDNSKNVLDRAYGHGMRNGVVRRAPSIVHTATYAAGGICSTAGDMVTWLRSLHGGEVLSPQSYAEMIAPSTLTDGTPLRYGMGLTVWNDSRDLEQIGHDGGGFGFSSQAWWHPDAQLAVVVLTNSEPDNTTAIVEALSAAVLPAGPAAPVFSDDTSPLIGTYKGRRGSMEMVIAVSPSPEGLVASINDAAPIPLTWIEGWTFRTRAPQLTFRRSGNGGPASELRFDTGGDHIILKGQ
jgi:CubicO group peptidase (beta-lactamase class C family)